MSDGPVAPRWTLRRHKVFVLPAFFLVLIMTGWSGFWLFAAHGAEREIHLWIARENILGRRWSCASLQQGGYPLAIELRCMQPRVETGIKGEALAVRLERAVVSAQIYPSKPLALALGGPAIVEKGDQKALVMDWRSLIISIPAPPDRMDRGSVVGEHLTFKAANRQAEESPIADIGIARLEGQIIPISVEMGAPQAMGFTLTGIHAPLLDTLSGTKDTATASGVMVLSQPDKIRSGSVAERLEQWRVSGGRLQIQSTTLSKGDININASGTMGIDQEHAPEGNLDFRLRGARQIALNAAVGSGLVGKNSLPAGLIGALLAEGRETPISLNAQNRVLSVGPLKGVMKLSPLY